MKRQEGFFTISVVAKHFGISAQTLRMYEDKGLLAPARSEGRKRLYDDTNLERIRLILRLTRDLGVNLPGVEVILNMRDKMVVMEKRYREVVELLLSEFQNVMDTVHDQDEEGLIPCNQSKLMKIKDKLAKMAMETREREPIKTIKIS